MTPNQPFETDLRRRASPACLAHARAEIERWRREYNEERPKKSLGGLPPAVYAKHLADKAINTLGRL